MNWYSAKTQCESIGMRLPTRNELKIAYNADLTRIWKEASFFSGDWFWTSEEELFFYGYYFAINFDYDFTVIKLAGSHVRCIKIKYD